MTKKNVKLSYKGDGKKLRAIVKPEDPLKPSAALLARLGSIIVHIDEYLSAEGHDFDLTVTRIQIASPEVQAWLKAMGPLVPQKRHTTSI